MDVVEIRLQLGYGFTKLDIDITCAVFAIEVADEAVFGRGAVQVGILLVDLLADGGNQLEIGVVIWHVHLFRVHGAFGQFFDACGLSPFDLSSADVFTQFLVAVSKTDYFADFEASLPVAGCDGTLKNWCRSNGLANRVIAKTGTMTNTRSLAGYLTASNGSRYAFCIMVNNYTGTPNDAKALIEKILYMIYENQ